MRATPGAVDLASVVRGVHQGPADPPTLLHADDGDHLALTVAASWVSRPTGRRHRCPRSRGERGIDQDALAGHGLEITALL